MTSFRLGERAAPVGWSVVPAGHLFRREKRSGYEAEQLLSVYRDYGVIPKDSRTDNFNKASEDLGAYQLVEPNDLVINKMKAWQGSLGVSEHRGIVSPAYFVASPTREFNRRFVHYLLRCEDYLVEYQTRSAGIRVNQWDLDWEDFRRVPLALPPLEYQERIANFLDEQTARIDALIAEKELLLSKLDELRWARVAKELLTEPLSTARPLRLKYLVESCQNGLWGDEPIEDGTNVIVVRVADFDKKNRRVTLENPTLRHIAQEKLQSRLLRRGDLLIEKSGGGPTTPVGNVVMFDADVPAICSNFIARMPVAKGHDPAFVCLMFQALYALGKNVPHIKQTSGIQNLDADSYLSQTVPIPPFEEQQILAQQILADFASMEALAESSIAAVELLREYRSSLISAAVTGQLDLSTFKAIAPTAETNMPA